MSVRVAGVDPGTVSLDVCALEDGSVFCDLTIPAAVLGTDPMALVQALVRCGPLDLVLGPSGYGLPLVPGRQVGDRELSLMLLVRADEAADDVGIGGMRRLVRELIAAGLPLVFGPGVIHLPSVPAHRKWNRIDMGTADKVCSAALCIHDQAERLGRRYSETSFIMLEIGGAFSAALAVDRGRVVDGVGGSSGPVGPRACGALDAEAAYLLGPSMSKRTVFSGGALALDADDETPGCTGGPSPPRRGEGWWALCEGGAKAVLSLTAVLPDPAEVLLTGRIGETPWMAHELGRALAAVAPVRTPTGLGVRAKVAAQGAALLADGLAGGRFAPLVDTMELRGASGSVLDHLRFAGADRIQLS